MDHHPAPAILIHSMTFVLTALLGGVVGFFAVSLYYDWVIMGGWHFFMA